MAMLMTTNKRNEISFPFTSAVISTYAHATEDETKVLNAFKEVVGNVQVEVTSLSGHHGNPILLFKAKIGKKEIHMWWKSFYERLDSFSRKKLLKEIKTKVDEGCFLYLRFDKQNASLGKLSLSDGDDVIRLKLKISAFPSRPQVAIHNVINYLGRLKA